MWNTVSKAISIALMSAVLASAADARPQSKEWRLMSFCAAHPGHNKCASPD